MDKEQLKPCPFCGGSAKIGLDDEVYCVDCFSGVQPKSLNVKDNIKEWNSRSDVIDIAEGKAYWVKSESGELMACKLVDGKWEGVDNPMDTEARKDAIIYRSKYNYTEKSGDTLINIGFDTCSELMRYIESNNIAIKKRTADSIQGMTVLEWIKDNTEVNE